MKTKIRKLKGKRDPHKFHWKIALTFVLILLTITFTIMQFHPTVIAVSWLGFNVAWIWEV